MVSAVHEQRQAPLEEGQEVQATHAIGEGEEGRLAESELPLAPGETPHGGVGPGGPEDRE